MARRNHSARRMNSTNDAPSLKPQSSKKSSAWSEPTPAEIERRIRSSLLPVVISLELADEVTSPVPRLPLIECSLSSWQEFVELQRVVEHLERPTRFRPDSEETDEDMLECMVFGSTAKPELQLSTTAVNSVHKFANTLLLRLQSLNLSVRSLLKDRVLVRLPSGFAAINSRKIVEWNAIVVAPGTTSGDEPVELIQRVELQHVSEEQRQLRHPRLVPMVEGMLEDHAQSGRVHVVILRGIPGSGKSSLGREVVAICKARGAHAIVCSADFYFETPRGYQFDVKGISKAHELSQKTFRQALTSKQTPVIVVDNTHTQKWEYEPYEQAAQDAGAQIHLLEMNCPDLLTCTLMAQRNSHGVSTVKVTAMYLRWTEDDRATIFHPSFQDPLILENPVTRNPMKYYVAYVGLFLDPPTRAQVLERVRPLHINVIAEHITLFYRPTTQYIRQTPIGKKFNVRVVSIVHDTKGQTLRIELDDHLPLKCMNKTPHITISTATGISAFYSNELLENEEATHVTVEDTWEFEVTLGIAVMANNRKIISLTSLFEDQFVTVGTKTEELPPSLPPSCDTVVVLDMDASDMRSARPDETVESTLLRHELVRHLSGPHATSQRVVIVRNGESTSPETETQLISAVHQSLSPSWSSNYLQFDTVLFRNSGETLASKLQVIGKSAKRVRVLTTRDAPMVAKELHGLSVPVSVTQLPRFVGSDEVSRLASAMDESLTRTLDIMSVASTEEACFTTQKAIEIAENVLVQCGHPEATVNRVDAALWTHPSSVVEIATTESLTDVAVEDLIPHFNKQGIHNVTIDENDEEAIALQFQLPTKGTQTPTIRWIVDRVSGLKTQLGDRMELVTDIRKRIRDELNGEVQEMYPRMTSIIGAVLRANVKCAIPAATLQLFVERVVVGFFLMTMVSVEPTSSDGRVVDHRVLWSRVVDCVRWLSSWTKNQWCSEVSQVHKTLVDEFSLEFRNVIQKACEIVSNVDEMSEKTGSPSWGQKIASLLMLDKK